MEASSHLSDVWSVYPELDHALFREAQEAGIDPLQAQLLWNRGLQSVEDMRSFLNADFEDTRDPHMLIDMNRAVERIYTALQHEEHITVYGDYDADGVTSSALLYRALRKLKKPDAQLDYHIPHRLRDGCGLNIPALDMLKERGTQLIITTDCASSDVEQVDYAKSLGIEVIITDHHHPPTRIPDAYAMVNPWRPECTYGERYLCGVGIAFKVVQALYRVSQRSTKENREEEKELLDLVAIGTIGDIAPLLGENHILVRLGLQRLNQTQKPGLQALKRYSNLTNVRIRERDIAFGIAPRINAAGRMDEAKIAFELLITDDPDKANALATRLEQLNQQRQQQTEELMRNVREQARQQTGLPIVLVNGDNWHEGIIGLVAGKQAEETGKPVLVLSTNPDTQLSRGSARSQKGFNIIEALRGFSQHLERYGGHAQAAGFTIRSEHIEQLREHLVSWHENGGAIPAALIAGTALPDPTGVVIEQGNGDTAPSVPLQKVDLTITRFERLSYQTYKFIRQLAPFGAGNPEPVFKVEHMYLIKTWASGPNKQNLSMRLGSPVSKEKGRNEPQQKGTLTRGASMKDQLEDVTYIDIIFRIDANEDDTRPDIWLKILDFKAVEEFTLLTPESGPPH